MVFTTPGFHGHSVEYSPFVGGRLAVASSQYFGLIGNGRLLVVDQLDELAVVRQLETREVLLDCAWSEGNERLLAGACSDGTVKLWDLGDSDGRPTVSYPGQAGGSDIFSVDWCIGDAQLFCQSLAQQAVVWSVADNARPLRTLCEHADLVYAVAWSPANGGLLLSASADRTVKLWDVNAPRSAATIAAHSHHVLSVDWNKYDDKLLLSASADRTVKLWDLRSAAEPLLTLSGHRLPVKNARWSPFHASVLASVSYDRSLRLWNVDPALHDPLISVVNNHSEFATAVSFSLADPHLIATCGWDSRLVVSSFPII